MEKKDKRGRGGFTLVEVLVVVVIITILAAIAVPTFVGYIDKAKEARYISEARTVSIGVQDYIIESHAMGTLNRTDIKKDLMLYDLGHPDHALTEILKGSYSDGARIMGLSVQLEEGRYDGMVYEVNGYKVTMDRGKKVTVEK